MAEELTQAEMPLLEAEEPLEEAAEEREEAPEAKASRKRPRVHCHDLKKMFTAPVASPARVGMQQGQASITLSAFHLREVAQEVCEVALMETDGTSLERRVLSAPVPLKELMDPVMLLEATVPLLESGQAVFRKLPKQWRDITGNNTALGTRCLFTSRRSEFSVLQVPERFIQVPPFAKSWQMEMVPAESFATVEKAPPIWSVQIHPEHELLRVLVRPGALLLRMLRRHNALPAARFVWRVQDAQQAQEVQETESADVGDFSMLSNREDPATTQPASFLHPLRIEQLRSLGWMLNQERPEKEAFATELRDSEACPDAAHWHLEGSLRCEYHDVKGGVLADCIGYGKTACTIGLIEKTKDLPAPRVPMPYRGFVASKATLVLAPTNLHQQWLAEIEKFTGKSLKVLSIPTCAQLKKYSMKDLAEADVVVATYRLFYSQLYLQRLEELARETKLGFTFPKSTGGQSSAWKEAYRSGFGALPTWCQRHLGLEEKRRRLIGKQNSPESFQKQYATLEESYFVPLEAFWWRRLVCDEFHELISRYPPAQTAVELFHADFKWGLSGTPPCETLLQIRKAAGFLGVQLPSGSREEERKVAQEWLDAFVRRNTSELPALEEEEHIVAVRQTLKEKALYEGLTEGEKEESCAELLKLCSHFCVSGEAPSASEECGRQMELRRQRLQAAQRDVKAFADQAHALVQLIQHFEPFFARSLEPAHFKAYSKASLCARAKFLGVKEASQDKAELLGQILSMASRRSSTWRAKALGRYFDGKSCGRGVQGSEEAGEAERKWVQLLELTKGEEDSQALETVGQSCVRLALLDALATATSQPPSKCLKMRETLKMPEYAKEDKALEEANWKWLNVKANQNKLLEIIDSWKAELLSCSTRLDRLKVEVTEKADSLDSFQDTMAATQVQQSSEDQEHEKGDFAKYGSKIEKLVRHVQQLQQQDGSAKLICFVQWEDLKKKVSRALAEFGVEHVTLSGGCFQRGRILRRFQYDLSGPRMLLLSLEESASGTNLTAANHVLIVHPMEAQSKEEAVAFEMQAVGRVRRPGQKKKIFIWRFVTMDTIEQSITEEHQKELWERQEARIEVSLPAAQGDASDEDMEEAACGPRVDELATQCYSGKELECTQAYS